MQAIESVHRGETIVQPAITENLLRGLKGHSIEFDSLPQPGGVNGIRKRDTKPGRQRL